MYISAGASSAPSATFSSNAVSPTHVFYGKTTTVGGGTYAIDSAPYTCTSNALTVNGGNYDDTLTGTLTSYAAGTAQGGFGDIGFMPVGTLYFYYAVGVSTTATISIPTVETAAWPQTVSATFVGSGGTKGTAGTNATCGGGYEAFAGSNFTGTNWQIYAVDDFGSTAILISGAAY